MEEEKKLEHEEINAIISAYDRAKNVQANIDIAPDFINAERQKKEFIEISLKNVLKKVRPAIKTIGLYVDYYKYDTGEVNEEGEPCVVYTGIKSEEIELDFAREENSKVWVCSVLFSIKGKTLEEIVEEILRRIDL